MSRIINKAEAWTSAYSAFQNINFSAFDYNTIKQSMLDYVKLYFPEDFNDYIESSEFIVILELFAYLGELIAYRQDMNAQENFLSTAQRKESVLRLAKLISYDPARNLPARGLVKITSISTTEHIVDSSGFDLANKTITWNDSNNINWKEQFLLVLNRSLLQPFGTVSPSERVQIDDVLFELYALNNQPTTNGVINYSAFVAGQSFPMELTPVTLDSNVGIYEKRPEINSAFTILYGSDGLGDSSNTTGFFIFTKQGRLQKFTTSFDGVTPNQTYDVQITNVNETDVWVNNIDPLTGETIDDGSSLSGKSGQWVEVDLAHAQNIVFNTNAKRTKYEIETLDNDKIRLIFGDGEFADIPSGTFDIWARTSSNTDLVIPQNSISNQQASVIYFDDSGSIQTLTLAFSLINSLQNASPSEDIEHIRRVAPSVYYTQDRMVNGQDYNTFMLQDPSILKLRAVNRTYAGDSKYITWHDPRETYENVKIFGDDLLLYYKDSTTFVSVTNVSDPNVLILNYIQPLLSSNDIYIRMISDGVPPGDIRRIFNATELLDLNIALSTVTAGGVVTLYYDNNPGPIPPYQNWIPAIGAVTPQTLIWIVKSNTDPNAWTVNHITRRIISESQTTRFWNTNNSNRVIDYDSLASVGDKIVLLKANLDNTRSNLFSSNKNFEVLGQEVIEPGQPDVGTPNINQLSVLPEDINGDGISDNIDLVGILNPSISVTTTGIKSLPISFIVGEGDVTIVGDVDSGTIYWTEYGTLNTPSNQVNITSLGTNTTATITVKDYVYFNRLSTIDPWIPQPTVDENISLFIADRAFYPIEEDRLWRRFNGRDNLNFAWLHFASQYHLIDPAASNIIDIFIITRGLYTQTRQWLDGILPSAPDNPTPLNLRTDYGYLLDNKMISDTLILHSGKFKILFGSKAPVELRAIFKVIRSQSKVLTDNQIKTTIVGVIKNFFDINKWEFGETFYFTELAAAIHAALPSDIDSVVLTPTYSRNQFGDLFQVIANEDEIFQPHISVSDIEIVQSYNAQVLRQNLS